MHWNNVCGWPLCVTRGRRPRIGCDIDGVIRDIDTTLEKIIAREYPKSKKISSQPWKIADRYVNVPIDLDTRMFTEFAKEIFFQASPYLGANKFILDLYKLSKKYDTTVAYVTKQGKQGSRETLAWLAKHNFQVNELYFVKTGPEYSKTTVECDILIDDNVDNLRHQSKIFGGAICKAQDWNINWVWMRFKTYEQILEQVEKELVGINAGINTFKLLPEEARVIELAFAYTRIDENKEKELDIRNTKT